MLWRSPTGKNIRLVSTRLVSLVQRSVAAIEYVVEAEDEFARITVQSELVANEDQPEQSSDPRVSAVPKHPLEAIQHPPDEYTAVMRDNVFTNLMAAHNFRTAADACNRHAETAYEMGVSNEETAAWRNAPGSAHIPHDDHLGVHQQCEGFTKLREWNFTDDTVYPLLLHQPYVRLYPSQVIKQADLVLAMQWHSHAFTDDQKARNVDYYERCTVRDSSLSACTQAVMCAEVGHLELAHDYTQEAALIDLRDLQHNTRDGLHMASLAGTWTALVAGFGGLRDDEHILSLDPQLPEEISRLKFGLRWRKYRLAAEITHDEVTYMLRDGPDGQLAIRHAGAELTLTTRGPTTVTLHPRRALLPTPEQPPGRAPRRHFQRAEHQPDLGPTCWMSFDGVEGQRHH